MARQEARDTAIAQIRRLYGPLGDLAPEVSSVVWVTFFRSVELAIAVREAGGPTVLTKDMLRGGRLMQDFQRAQHRVEFLQKMVAIIRTSKSNWDRLADSQLLVDVLKWGIEDAATMSGIRRTFVRQFAKADPEYQNQVPAEIL